MLTRQQKAFIGHALYVYIMGQTSAAAAVNRTVTAGEGVRSVEHMDQRMKNCVGHIKNTVTIASELLEHGNLQLFLKELSEHSDPVAREGILLIINHDADEMAAVGFTRDMFRLPAPAEA